MRSGPVFETPPRVHPAVDCRGNLSCLAQVDVDTPGAVDRVVNEFVKNITKSSGARKTLTSVHREQGSECLRSVAGAAFRSVPEPNWSAVAVVSVVVVRMTASNHWCVESHCDRVRMLHD